MAGLGPVEWRRPPEPLQKWVLAGQGPSASRVAGGAGEAKERGSWHDATPAVLGVGSGAGWGLTLLLDGVKCMFFLWK